MIIDGHRLKPIEAYKARKLPEGSVLIVERLWRDYKSYAVTKREYYRVRTKEKRTVSGPDIAIYSEPNADWPMMPTWQDAWIWLEEIPGFMGYYEIEDETNA